MADERNVSNNQKQWLENVGRLLVLSGQAVFLLVHGLSKIYTNPILFLENLCHVMESCFVRNILHILYPDSRQCVQPQFSKGIDWPQSDLRLYCVDGGKRVSYE